MSSHATDLAVYAKSSSSSSFPSHVIYEWKLVDDASDVMLCDRKVLKDDRSPMNTDYSHYKVTRKNCLTATSLHLWTVLFCIYGLWYYYFCCTVCTALLFSYLAFFIAASVWNKLIHSNCRFFCVFSVLFFVLEKFFQSCYVGCCWWELMILRKYVENLYNVSLFLVSFVI